MVRNSQYSCEPFEYLGQSNNGNAIATTAEIQMLWLPECDDAAFHYGQSMYGSVGCDEFAGMCRALLVLRQFIARQGLYDGFRHCCDRCDACTGNRVFAQGSKREGAI